MKLSEKVREIGEHLKGIGAELEAGNLPMDRLVAASDCLYQASADLMSIVEAVHAHSKKEDRTGYS